MKIEASDSFAKLTVNMTKCSNGYLSFFRYKCRNITFVSENVVKKTQYDSLLYLYQIAKKQIGKVGNLNLAENLFQQELDKYQFKLI